MLITVNYSRLDKGDWRYTIMVNSVKAYLKDPKLISSEVSETGWIKNFNLTHGKSTLEFIEENMNLWLKRESIEIYIQ